MAAPLISEVNVPSSNPTTDEPGVLAEGLEQIVDPVALLAADHLHGHLEPLAHVDVNHLEAGSEVTRG